MYKSYVFVIDLLSIRVLYSSISSHLLLLHFHLIIHLVHPAIYTAGMLLICWVGVHGFLTMCILVNCWLGFHGFVLAKLMMFGNQKLTGVCNLCSIWKWRVITNVYLLVLLSRCGMLLLKTFDHFTLQHPKILMSFRYCVWWLSVQVWDAVAKEDSVLLWAGTLSKLIY